MHVLLSLSAAGNLLVACGDGDDDVIYNMLYLLIQMVETQLHLYCLVLYLLRQRPTRTCSLATSTSYLEVHLVELIFLQLSALPGKLQRKGNQVCITYSPACFRQIQDTCCFYLERELGGEQLMMNPSLKSTCSELAEEINRKGMGAGLQLGQLSYLWILTLEIIPNSNEI